MKKIALLLLAFCFLFSGCNTEKTVTPITQGIEFVLNITYGEVESNVTVVIDNGGCMKATVNSPKEIAGMKITANKFETVSEYKNLKYTYNEDDFTGNNCVVTIYNILPSLNDKQLSLKDGENCIFTGTYLGEEYEFMFSPSGLPIILNINSQKLKAVFGDIAVI